MGKQENSSITAGICEGRSTTLFRRLQEAFALTPKDGFELRV